MPLDEREGFYGPWPKDGCSYGAVIFKNGELVLLDG